MFSTLIVSWANAQVAIGKASVTNASVSLEFFEGTTVPLNPNVRGLILPWASTVSGNPDASYKGISSPVDGTLLFDPSDYKVKYRKGSSTLPSTWFDLTVISKTDMTPNPNVATGLSEQGGTLEDKSGARAAIGANADTNNIDGVLVLTDTNKAMILPKVASPQTAIQEPSAGMIVYDTDKRLLCVYNGTVWTFWKP